MGMELVLPASASAEFLEKPQILGLTLMVSSVGYNCGADALQSRLVAKHL